MEIINWDILHKYFTDNPNFISKHHLESYNDFINTKIPNTIKSLNPFITLKNDENGLPKHEVRVYIGGEDGKSIYLTKPIIKDDSTESYRPLYPNEARLKNKTYACELACDILVKYITLDPSSGMPIHAPENKEFKKIKIGMIPIMLQSNICITNSQPQQLLKELGECPYDQGGYFIIDGKEKVIVAQERIATNRLFINKSKEHHLSFEGLIRCTTEAAAVFPKTVRIVVYNGKTKSNSSSSILPKSDELLNRKNAISFIIPNINREVPIFILFRALGIISDKRILEYILYDLEDENNKTLLDFLYASVIDSSFIYTQQEALEFLQKHVQYDDINYVKFVMMNDLFPNLNQGSGDDTSVSLNQKALFLGHIIHHIVKVCLSIERESDRDNYTFKRVDLSGFLMSNLFRDFYNQFRNECRSQIDREYLYGPWKKESKFSELINKTNQWKIFNSKFLSVGLIKSLKSAWGVEQSKDKQGIVQDLSRLSYLGSTSHLRRVNTPIDRSIKIVEPHRLHPSQWGCMCPCESPDGASIGLLKNFALLCHVTSDCNSQHIKECLNDLDVIRLDYVSPKDITNSVKVLVNSNWYGITKTPDVLVERLRLLRRNAFINVMTSISWNIFANEININTEAGRCARPLLIVKNKQIAVKKNQQWFSMIKGNSLNDDQFDMTSCEYRNPYTFFGISKSSDNEDHNVWNILRKNQSVIEFIDVEESNTCLIAMNLNSLVEDSSKTYTHCEIHPSTMFAVLTANIPFANHNQAPRNYFSGAQGKQAIGVYSTQFNNRMDTMGFVLHYPQKAIVNTKYMTYLNNNNLPNGVNTIVAIMCYTGYNQEDSIIINRSAIERGLFNLTYYKTYVETEEENEYSGDKVLFGNPFEMTKQGKNVEGFGQRFANYSKLDENGFPKENSKITEGDVYIGKYLEKPITIDDPSQNDNIFKTQIQSVNYKDKSSIADKTLYATIDKVYVFNDDTTGLKNCKIRFRKVRTPVLGDKHASRNAQKGVIGAILDEKDMPFTKDGIKPDLIINPHAIPTRMTIAHLIECVLGKLGAIEGQCYDATPFCNQNIEAAYAALQNKGYERYGNEIMYCGITGEQIPTEIFIGPTYYLRLKHMVQDKYNYRARNEGPYTTMTRQPVKSRGKGGGLKMGEMEQMSVLAHGIASTMKESCLERSDDYKFTIDKNTGDVAIGNVSIGHVQSLTNPHNTHFAMIKSPYSMKLFIQELQTMSIIPRIITQEDKLDIEEDEFDGSYDDDIENDADENDYDE